MAEATSQQLRKTAAISASGRSSDWPRSTVKLSNELVVNTALGTNVEKHRRFRL